MCSLHSFFVGARTLVVHMPKAITFIATTVIVTVLWLAVLLEIVQIGLSPTVSGLVPYVCILSFRIISIRIMIITMIIHY